MQELKNKIQKCAEERSEYKQKLEEIYEIILGEKGFERYEQAEFVDYLNIIHGDYLLMQHATSDEYVDLYNRMEGK
jgi:hypothetical protein